MSIYGWVGRATLRKIELAYPIDISHACPHIFSMNAHSKLSRIASLFRSNRSQAVRIPKDLEFPEGVKKVVIRRDGENLVIAPEGNFWERFFDEPGIDLGPRDQPPPQERDWKL